MKEKTKIAAAQWSPVFLNKEKTVEKAFKAITEAGENGAKVMVFPEAYIYNPLFMTTVIFDAKGEETGIEWTLRFDTPEMRETMIKVHKADEGQKENIEKLEKYLSKLRAESHGR